MVEKKRNSGMFVKGDSRIYDVKANGGTPGSFKPGYDPRRLTHDGRPPVSLSGIAREYTEEAFGVALDIMKDTNAPKTARLRAAELVLVRGHGKPETISDMVQAGISLKEKASKMTLTEIQEELGKRRPAEIFDVEAVEERTEM